MPQSKKLILQSSNQKGPAFCSAPLKFCGNFSGCIFLAARQTVVRSQSCSGNHAETTKMCIFNSSFKQSNQKSNGSFDLSTARLNLRSRKSRTTLFNSVFENLPLTIYAGFSAFAYRAEFVNDLEFVIELKIFFHSIRAEIINGL